MSRYDRYSQPAMDILYAVQDIVRGEGRSESGLGDLARAILISAIPDLLEIAARNDRSLDRDKLMELCARLEIRGPGAELADAGRGDGPPPAAEGRDGAETGPISLSGDFRAVLDKAEDMAGSESVKPAHIIHAAWNSIRGEIAPYFGRTQAQAPGTEPLSAPGTEPLRAGPESAAEGDLVLPELEREPDRDEAAAFLSSFGRELTSRELSFEVFGRDREIDALASALLRRYKPNPLLIGEPGVGKTAIVEGLAERIKAGRVPQRLKRVRIFELRLSDLAAGTSVHGAFEERLKAVIAAAESDPDLVLFFDEMHALAQAYGNEPSADILKPALSRGRMRCVGAAALADYHRFIEKDEAFARRFQSILVKEPEAGEVLAILRGLRPGLESHFGLSVPDSALARAYDLSSRHVAGRYFPDKAIDALDRACSKALFAGEKELGEERLREAVADMANVSFEGSVDDGSGLEGLEERLRLDIVGQDEAIRRVCGVLGVCKRRLDLRPERPDGAFLFTGPTGVGKTALAESLARRLTGREDALFRIDMSEFSESHTVARLLGAPPGYVGYGDIALLAQAAERNPSGVLLLDEFEKAHPQVHRLFLQILDSGRATDAYGKRLSFSDMTIIATCNVNDDPRSLIGFQGGEAGALPVLPLARLKQVFPPELLNRFDALVPFKPLSRAECLSILEGILIGANNRSLEKEYGFRIEYRADLLESLLSEGFSPDFGARNLHRVFQERILLPLSRSIEALRGARLVEAAPGLDGVAFAPKSGN